MKHFIFSDNDLVFTNLKLDQIERGP
jgi:hypothetical protein